MNNEWIDVSVTLRDGMPHWPGDLPFERTLTSTIAQGGGANLSQIALSAHTGTHMDAPRHFIDGAPAIDSMPIDATVGRARVIAIKDPEMIRLSEVEPHRIGPGERILFKTLNSSRLWTSGEFQQDYIYIPPDTARYLAAAGVRTVGVDYLSVGGFHSGNPETHRALLGAGIWIIEGLNLENIEPGEYELICLPLKLEGSDGAPARAALKRI